MPYRYRQVTDLLVDEPLSNWQLSQISKNAQSLINVAAVSDVDGVTTILRITPIVSSCHYHQSNDYEQCAECRSMARDGLNDESQE